MRTMKKTLLKVYLVVSLICLLVMGGFIFTNRKVLSPENIAVADAHLEYLTGEITAIRPESIVMSFTKSTMANDQLPPKGTAIYLFIPQVAVQEEMQNTYKRGEQITVSVYGPDSLHNNNGLYSLVIMQADQIRND